jgi:hypothetical protein
VKYGLLVVGNSARIDKSAKFLGLCNYYRLFERKFVKIEIPIGFTFGMSVPEIFDPFGE